MGIRLQGATSPLGRIVRPETPAAHPLMAVLPASAGDGSFICDAMGSPVTISSPLTSREDNDAYNALVCSGVIICDSRELPLPQGTSRENPIRLAPTWEPKATIFFT
jgi:hypothetical protein